MAIDMDEPITSINKKHKEKTLNSEIADKKFKGQLGFFSFSELTCCSINR